MTLERALTPLRIATLVGACVAALRVAGCGSLTDLRAMDYRLLQRGPRPASPDVVIVAVDDASIAAIGRWPWPRALIARLIERLVAADAAIIGFDIVQSEATVAQSLEGVRARVDGIDNDTWQRVRQALSEIGQDDKFLTDTVRASQRAVLGYFLEMEANDAHDGAGAVSEFNIVRPSRDGSGERLVVRASSLRANLPQLTDAARDVGFFNVIPDPDGFIRHAPLAIRMGERLTVPLPLAMLRAYRPENALQIQFAEYGVDSVRVGATRVPVREDGQLLLNYRGPGRTFVHLSAADVLAGRVPAEAVRGKLVLVGVTATAVADVRVTPFDGVFPGVETHATVLDNVLRNDFIARPRWVLYVELAVIFASVYGLAIALRTLHGAAGALVAATALGVYVFASHWLFTSRGLVLSYVYPFLGITITYVTVALRQYIAVSRQRRELRHALGLYLAPSVARLVSERPDMLKLGGDKRELTVLFCDIRGFSAIAEQLEPQALVELLHVYLGAMTDVIFAHDGTLDKYIGDAIMAFWGAPLTQEKHAEQGCAAAVEMVARLRDLEVEWERRGWPFLAMGIGLNSGEMVVGNMGSERRLSYTVAGDNVNLGSRLEGLTKVYGSRILASEATIEEANGTVVVRELDIVRVQGRATPVRIFEILGPASEEQRWAPVKAGFDAGLQAYRTRRWDEACSAFEALLKERPNDVAARLFVTRCRRLIQTPPPPTWDAVTDFDTK
jgi:adenylate cyclase